MKRIERMVNLKFPILFAFFFAGVFTLLQAQDERRFIRKGTDKYNKGDFVESGNEYWKALDKNQNSLEARFNVAATMFKQEKYQDAIKQLQALSNQTNDKDVLGKIFHNIGNSYMGLNDLDNGINAYKTALKNNPFDDETRYNLIAAMKMKKQQEDQQDQKQEQQEKEQKKEQEQQQQNQEQQQEQQQGISRENAERILQAMEEDEKKLQEKLNKQKETQPVRIEKNW